MGDGYRRTSGGRQQHQQQLVEVGAGRTHERQVWSRLRLVGRTLARGLRPRRRGGTERASPVGGVEPHPARARSLGRGRARKIPRHAARTEGARHDADGHAASFFRSAVGLGTRRLGKCGDGDSAVREIRPQDGGRAQGILHAVGARSTSRMFTPSSGYIRRRIPARRK